MTDTLAAYKDIELRVRPPWKYRLTRIARFMKTPYGSAAISILSRLLQ